MLFYETYNRFIFKADGATDGLKATLEEDAVEPYMFENDETLYYSTTCPVTAHRLKHVHQLQSVKVEHVQQADVPGIVAFCIYATIALLSVNYIFIEPLPTTFAGTIGVVAVTLAVYLAIFSIIFTYHGMFANRFLRTLSLESKIVLEGITMDKGATVMYVHLPHGSGAVMIYGVRTQLWDHHELLRIRVSPNRIINLLELLRGHEGHGW